MYDVGLAAVESLAAGVAARKSMLVAQMREVALEAMGAARKVLEGGEYGANSTSKAPRTADTTGELPKLQNTTVNVSYSGAYTRKEAKNFGRELASQLAAEASGKGG